MVVPTIFKQTAGTEPIFIYVVSTGPDIGRVSVDINYSESGASAKCAGTVEKLSWYIERGRQFKVQLGFDFHDQTLFESLIATGDKSDEEFLKLRHRLGEKSRTLATKIRAGEKIPQGSFLTIGGLYSFQGIPHP